MNKRYLILDIEADNLLHDVTQVWCVVLQDVSSEEVFTFTHLEKFAGLDQFLYNPNNIFIAHNGIAYDMPVLKKLLGYQIPWHQVYDTLILSRMFNSDRFGGHSLKSYGAELGCPKQEFTDFSQYSPQMLEYCIQDTTVTRKVWNLFSHLITKYKKSIDIDREFAHYISLQEQNGFCLDVGFATAYCTKLEAENEVLTDDLFKIVPKVKVIPPLYKAAKLEGRLIAESITDFTYITAKTKVIKKVAYKFAEFNPNSRQQIVDLFKSKYGWVPIEFSEKGSPKVDADVLGGLHYPEAQLLVKILDINKKLGQLKSGQNAWLRQVKEDGRVYGAAIVNGATGGRCTHRIISNINKDPNMRKCWIARAGWVLVGCDASGLEARTLAHYLSHFDGGQYAEQIYKGDIHLYNKKILGLQNRDTAKVAFFAAVYRAQGLKLGKIVKDDLGLKTAAEMKQAGNKRRDLLLANLSGYQELLDMIEETLEKRRYMRCIDGRPLKPRRDYAAINLLIQASGAAIMKQALNNFMRRMQELKLKHGQDYAFCANIHDEVVIECRPDVAEAMAREFREAIVKVTDDLKLKCRLDGESKVGQNWLEVH